MGSNPLKADEAGSLTNLIQDRCIAIVGNDPADRAAIAQHFDGIRCQIKMMDNSSEALESMARQPHPDVVILAAEESVAKALPFVDQVAVQTESTVPVFLVSKKLETDTDIDEAFFRGVEAVFFQPLKTDDLLKGMSFSLEIKVERSDRQHKRRRIRRAKIEYLNESTGLTSSGYVMNISQGGMYVCSMYNHPEKLHRITFRINHEGPNAKEIVGSGIVRWLRPSAEFGRPPGFGVEFRELDSHAREEIAAITNTEQDDLGK